jgi:hypothetical protein
MMQLLHSVQNTVVAAGPFVVKHIRGSNAGRRFSSEILTRIALKQTNISFIPILFAIAPLNLFAMPRRSACVASNCRETVVQQIAAHAYSSVTQLHVNEFQGGYAWLDSPSRMKVFSSFGRFLRDELVRYVARYGSQFLGDKAEWVDRALSACPIADDRIFCLNDVSPKNVVASDGNIIHFDLEGTILGPSDYFLTKTAVNLVRDLGTPALESATWLLSKCVSPDLVKSSLAFIMTRMLLLHRIAGPGLLSPNQALSALESHGRGVSALEEIAYARDKITRGHN